MHSTCALGVVVLGALTGSLIAEGAETKTKPAASQSSTVTPAFSPCHPPGADMSPDGKLFMIITPDQAMLGLLEMGPEQKNHSIPLPKRPADAIFVDTTRLVVSFGHWGELALLDTQQPPLGTPFRVGASAGLLCRLSGGRVVVLDTQANQLYIVDPQMQATVQTLPVPSAAAQIGWVIPDLELEVVDAQGQRVGTIALPRPTSSE